MKSKIRKMKPKLDIRVKEKDMKDLMFFMSDSLFVPNIFSTLSLSLSLSLF
jgi:hypothetical protein